MHRLATAKRSLVNDHFTSTLRSKTESEQFFFLKGQGGEITRTCIEERVSGHVQDDVPRVVVVYVPLENHTYRSHRKGVVSINKRTKRTKRPAGSE